MEEIYQYLIERDLDVELNELWENERKSKAGFFANAEYSFQNLKDDDPSHWSTIDNQNIKSLSFVKYASNYTIIYDWQAYEIDETPDRSAETWLYATSFNETLEWSLTEKSNSVVRRRKLQRLLCDDSQRKHAKRAISALANQKSIFRTLNMSMMKAALRGIDHEFHIIMESQRALNANESSFSSSHLSTADPPRWSSGDTNLMVDPRTFNIELYPIKPEPLVCPQGAWTALHEFIYVVYPSGDEFGWEYNVNFDWPDSWKSVHFHEARVRRRIWFRTTVRISQRDEAIHRYRLYTEQHPRGIIKKGEVLKLGDFHVLWHEGTGILKDNTFEFHCRTQLPYSTPLDRCEISRETDSKVNPNGDNIISLQPFGSSDPKLKCLLKINSSSEINEWISAFTLQLALVNIGFWSAAFGSPLEAGVVMRGELWKKGHVVPTWKLRTFELRESGILSYYKGDVRRGSVSLRKSNITLNGDTIEIVNPDGYTLSLKSPCGSIDTWLPVLKNQSFLLRFAQLDNCVKTEIEKPIEDSVTEEVQPIAEEVLENEPEEIEDEIPDDANVFEALKQRYETVKKLSRGYTLPIDNEEDEELDFDAMLSESDDDEDEIVVFS